MESSSNLKAEIKTEKSSCMLALSFAILISLGVSLPLLSFIQPQFPKTTSHTVMAEIEQMEGISSAVKQKIRDVPVEFVYKGIALYPRFYEAGQGEPSSDVFYKAKDYARLLFVYLGSDRYNTELATDEIPFDIKNTSKIFIGGKMIENAFYAEWLIVDDQVASVYFSNRFR